MKKSYIIFTLLLALATSSCSDFLDVRPKGEKVEDEMFDSAQGFEDAIYGVYGSMTDNTLYGRDLLFAIPGALSQDLNCSIEFGRALARYEYEDNSTVRSRFLSLWTNAYKTIGYANNVLQNLEKKSPDEFPLYNIYKGEMLGVRAMIHLDLLRLFGPSDKTKTGIPYVTAYSFSVKPFLTVDECYKNILADLTEAERLLEEDAKIITYPRNDEQYDRFCNWRETHINLYAVRALLARVHHTLGNKAEAASYAESVIKSNAFPLVDVSEVQDFMAGVVSTKETIFGLYSTSHYDLCTTSLYNYSSYNESWAPYDEVQGNTPLMAWYDVYNLDIDGTQQDFRKNHFRQSVRSSSWLKFVDYRRIEDLTANPAPIKGINLIHVAEMYLIAADALLEADYPRALGYFNAEIASRGLTPLRSDETLTEQRINNEFHKELFGCAEQWFNMKRRNIDIVSNAEVRTIPASDKMYVLPVPPEEFDYRQ